MNPQARKALVDALCHAYTQEQLNQVVREFLQHDLEYYAVAGSYAAIVDKLLDELDRSTSDLLKLLIGIMLRTTRPELKSAIEAYLGIASQSSDPYDTLLVFAQPFVDRTTFRRKLRDLFDGPYKRVLLTRGAQGSGRTYCLNLIQHTAEARGIRVAALDLLDTPTPDDLIGQIINTMSLDPKQLRDRVAQLSTQGKGLASALRGEAAKFAQQGQRWCIVIDHLDRDEVSDPARELFIPLIQDVARRQVPNVWMVALGFKGQLGAGLTGALIDDELLPLSRTDVEQYMTAFVRQKNAQHVDEPALLTKIFAGLTPPLVGETLLTMSQRLSVQLDGM